MSTEITSTLTAIGVFFTGLSSVILVALKISRAIRNRKSTANTPSSAGWWTKVPWRLVFEAFKVTVMSLVFAYAVVMLYRMQFRAAPLTAGDAATLVLCALFSLPTILSQPPRE